jgi:hypothetical protein
MNHDEVQLRILLLLADRRQDVNSPILQLERGAADIAMLVTRFDAMQPLDRDVLHLVGNRVLAIAGEAIDAGSHDEVGSQIPRLAKSS